MAKIDFNLKDHARFVKDRGESVTWYRMTPCPCSEGGDMGRSNLICPYCLRTGQRYEAGQEIVAVITGINRQRAWLESGMATPSDLVMSLSPQESARVSDWDIVELSGWDAGQVTQGEIIKRSPLGLTDQLQFQGVSALSCYSIDPETLAVQQTYEQGLDFALSGKTLTWFGSPRPLPEPESFYSLKYTALYQWVVFSPPGDRFDRGVSLGDKVMLRQRQTAMRDLEISNG